MEVIHVPTGSLLICLFLHGTLLAQELPVYENKCLTSTSCGQCIKQDPSCGWCTEVEYNGTRCDQVETMILKGCSNITHPRGSVETVKNDTLADAKDSPDGIAVQVSPQRINVTLKIGEPQTVRLNVRFAKDYPLDLYYLMDLSKSLKEDLVNLGNIGRELASTLQGLTEDHQIGFGAFVDKTSLPFVSTDLDTCVEDDGKACCPGCRDPFSFINELTLTNNTDRFTERIRQLTISHSLDGPEGGLDALVQVIRCKEQIGWRKNARRMVFFATDDELHFAGDGKMAGVTRPNDGQCHMQSGSNVYLKSTYMDYPSIGQINALVHESNIVPVFAVTQRRVELYQALQLLITGSYVGVLATNSADVLTLVKNIYRSVTSAVDIIDTVPDNIDIVYTAICGNGVPVDESSRRCEGIALGDIVSFDVELTARNCSQKQQTFTVRPLGFDESLTIVTNIICDCQCEDNGIRDPTMCSGGNGTLTCGKCVCDEGRGGEECDCDGGSEADTDYSQCLAPNSTSTVLCQGRGLCMCGRCECNKPMNPDNTISGKFCECDNFSCTKHHGELCGGKTRGDCTCGGICNCKSEYTGDGCDCLKSTKACETISGLLCNGFGECKCGQCVCEKGSPFYGPTCEDCANCVGKCSSFRECVLCSVFNQGAFTEDQCNMCKVPIEIVDGIYLNATDAVPCAYIDDDNCTIKYSYEMTENATYIVYVQATKECRTTVMMPRTRLLSLTWLIVIIVAVILFIGIVLLALLRLLFFIQDKREFAKFEKERKDASWSNSDNPLFKSVTTTFVNPMHGQ